MQSTVRAAVKVPVGTMAESVMELGTCGDLRQTSKNRPDMDVGTVTSSAPYWSRRPGGAAFDQHRPLGRRGPGVILPAAENGAVPLTVVIRPALPDSPLSSSTHLLSSSSSLRTLGISLLN